MQSLKTMDCVINTAISSLFVDVRSQFVIGKLLQLRASRHSNLEDCRGWFPKRTISVHLRDIVSRSHSCYWYRCVFWGGHPKYYPSKYMCFSTCRQLDMSLINRKPLLNKCIFWGATLKSTVSRMRTHSQQRGHCARSWTQARASSWCVRTTELSRHFKHSRLVGSCFFNFRFLINFVTINLHRLMYYSVQLICILYTKDVS